MFYNTAFAQSSGASTGAGGGVLGLLLPFLVVILFYFMLFRPQRKHAKEHRAMLGMLAVGDEVITDSGIMGKVTDIKEHRIILDLGNSRVAFRKGAVQSILPKGTLE